MDEIELFPPGFAPKLRGTVSQATGTTTFSGLSTVDASPDLKAMIQSQLECFTKENDKTLYLKAAAADGLVSYLY